jgi:hypothetical protein
MVSVVALVCWVTNATLGLSMLLGWRRGPSRPPGLAYRHAATGLLGLALWVGFLAADRPAWLAWTAFAVVFLANGLGDWLTLAGWRMRNAGGTGRPRDLATAVGEVVGLRRGVTVLAHALLAAATFFSVVLAALGVGR